MSDKKYTPRPTCKICFICGEPLYGELVGGKVKNGGTQCAHKSCWEREQAENARRAKR